FKGNFCIHGSPKRERDFNPAPLLPKREKGLGDEGKLAKLGCTLDKPSESKTFLKQDDIERLHHAKEILIAQFNHPPSILSLARQVGLNDFKLKQGFRQVFGNTVFGYLRDYRLEQAHLLLLEGQMNVQQVARALGYTHSGYFAKAFKQKFGVSPKTYQLNKDQRTLFAIKNPSSA
ncbi:MAG: helix-turn-helix transcriptional regulator, partial [Leptolyngbyaceae cyanobacterium RM1_406_9]|nr:helix-turn-helix transcriptional regulator [Leptolyngbyaceae cyanobacterium RM1_406_9]